MPVQFVVVRGKPAGKTLNFSRGDYLIGRGTECHIRPNSDWVGRQHCLLRVDQRGASLRHLGSRNGTLVNGARLVAECVLRDGDRVEIGPLVFHVQIAVTREIKSPARGTPVESDKQAGSPTELTQDQPALGETPPGV